MAVVSAVSYAVIVQAESGLRLVRVTYMMLSREIYISAGTRPRRTWQKEDYPAAWPPDIESARLAAEMYMEQTEEM